MKPTTEKVSLSTSKHYVWYNTKRKKYARRKQVRFKHFGEDRIRLVGTLTKSLLQATSFTSKEDANRFKHTLGVNLRTKAGKEQWELRILVVDKHTRVSYYTEPIKPNQVENTCVCNREKITIN
jgi:hypothetical protein